MIDRIFIDATKLGAMLAAHEDKMANHQRELKAAKHPVSTPKLSVKESSGGTGGNEGGDAVSHPHATIGLTLR